MIPESKASRASHLLAHTLRRRSTILILVVLSLVVLYPLGSPYLPTPPSPLSPSENLTPYEQQQTPETQSAREISAYDLLNRPVSQDRTSIPKLIHQTWFPAGSNMSDSAKQWVQTVKDFHPGWEYVLWDDESDEALVERYFPWFLETYKSLPKEINRADMVRNFYMYLFGGMYADVDTEALRPVDTLFLAHDVRLRSHTEELSAQPATRPVQRAFMGRMAHTLDAEGLGAIPNGWMASPPGHPFFLLPVLAVMENPKGDGSVEGMTGPGILGPLIKQYVSSGGGTGAPEDGERLRRQLCGRIQSVQRSWDLYCPGHESLDSGERDGEQIGHSLVLLPREQIYPFSWVDDGAVRVCLGAKKNELFDAEAC
ncbi:nucleotide-diphospho-sugar transferase, partial [Aspergillus unguis]